MGSIPILILQHPAEKNRAHGTVPLVLETLPESTARTGLSWKNLAHALSKAMAKAGAKDQVLEPRRWGVLFPGTGVKAAAAGASLQGAQGPLVAVNKSGVPIPSPFADTPPDGLVVLDGSWRDVKAMWWRNPWLLKLQRLVLIPTDVSEYKHIRRSPRDEQVSTAEAVALTLRALGLPSEELEERFKRFLLEARN